MSVHPSDVGISYRQVVPSSPSLNSNAPARAQFVGITAKGPLNHPGVITTLAQYEATFGGPAPYDTLYHPVRSYIEEQGGVGECYITRVVGPAATNGAVTLRTGGDTPVDTVTVTVTDPGEHTTTYQAAVTETSAGTTVTVTDTVSGRSLGAFGPATTVEELVDSALGHRDVSLTPLGAAGLPAPGVYPLSGGSDDRAGVTDQVIVDALDAHKTVPSGVGVAVPGRAASTSLVAGVGGHVNARHKIYVTSPRQGATLDEAKAVGDTLVGSPYGHRVAVVYPHLRVPDSGSRTRVVSPEGYVLAARSVTHRTKSPAAAPAGAARKTTWVTTPVTILDEGDINALNVSRVNGIVTEGGRHYLYNWVSLSTDPALFNVNDTDAANAITASIDGRLRGDEILFEPNGRPELLTRIEGHVATALAPYAERGYLQPRVDADGAEIDPGYVIRVEDVNSSGQDAPYDQLAVEVDVRFRPTLRHVSMTVRRLEFRYDLTAAAAVAA